MRDIDAKAYVADVVQRSGSSFVSAMRILPPAKRDGMYAVYAFCREVDDIADAPGAAAEKRRKLAEWRAEIDRLFDGRPETPIGRALLDPVRVYGLRREVFLAVVAGMEIDSADRLRLPDMAALEDYCDKVACAVGRLSNPVFGVEDGLGEPVAVALGHALQLTNILRDLAEDAALNRLYVPHELLMRFDIPDDDATAALGHIRFPEACDVLATLAARRFAEAETALARCNRRIMRPAIMMMAVYRAMLGKLRRRGWRDLDRPVGLGAAEKLWIFVRYAVL
jgi:phytoene synthase